MWRLSRTTLWGDFTGRLIGATLRGRVNGGKLIGGDLIVASYWGDFMGQLIGRHYEGDLMEATYWGTLRRRVIGATLWGNLMEAT